MKKITITVKPGSSQEKITQISQDELVVYLRAKPHDGEANISLIKLLAKYYNIPKTSIRISSGAKSRHKNFIVGNGTASRPGTPSSSQKLRSLFPHPHAGGIPYSSISTKSISNICASSSPASRAACCSSNRSNWSKGSFNSEKPFPISVPAIIGWNRSVTKGFSADFFAKGDRLKGSSTNQYGPAEVLRISFHTWSIRRASDTSKLVSTPFSFRIWMSCSRAISQLRVWWSVWCHRSR